MERVVGVVGMVLAHLVMVAAVVMAARSLLSSPLLLGRLWRSTFQQVVGVEVAVAVVKAAAGAGTLPLT